jgi:hypothetical protein
MPRAILPFAACCGLLASGCSPEGGTTPPIARELTGDITVTAEADLAALANVTRLDGSLIVRRSTLEKLELPDLLEVTGDLRIQKNPALASVHLGALVAVGGAGPGKQLVIENNEALADFDAGSLAGAPGGVLLRANPRLARIDLGALESVGGQGLELASADGLALLSLGRLRSASRLVVESCHRLTGLELGALTAADAVWVLANPSLREIALPPPVLAEGDAGPPRRRSGADTVIRVRDNTALPNCEARRLFDRLVERGFGGTAELCRNGADTCPPEGCPES